MSDRYTRKHAEAAFRALAQALSQDSWHLDHNAAYGGYTIQDDNGHRPFGTARLRARDFSIACRYALDALWFAGVGQ